ncbi:MAG: hypothetical protein LBG07_12280 [Treponema sp.]|nr:hypothetical protein [Treponema sp.]
MNFLGDLKIAAFALVLILGFLPILGAQTTPSVSPADVWDLLPESRDLHFPESSTSKATAGTLSGDPDAFMSPVDWSSIENMESTYILGGVDEWGLALGFAKKFGKLYLGASYSGDLIDEIYRRITNKELNAFSKVDRKTDGTPGSFSSAFLNHDEIPEGLAISNNDVNVIIGAGVFGLRLGFAEYIRSVQNTSDAPYWGLEDSLESSLKPNLELGFNIPAEKVTIKPSLRAALDIHQFRSRLGYLVTDVGTPANPQAPTTYWVVQTDEINFVEPSVGLTVAVEFAVSDTASMEFALEGDGVFRLYRGKDDPDRINTGIIYGDVSSGYPSHALNIPFPSGTSVSLPGDFTTIPLDFQITGAPSFAFTGDITDRITLGVKIAIDSGFGIRTIETEYTGVGTESSTVLTISAAPDLALGASFHLIPDHFSLHVGIGVQLFSYKRAATTFEVPAGGTVPGKETTSTFSLPSARIGGGLTVNLTQAVALDAMAFSSGLDFDSTKFNLILTIKK